MRGVGVRGTKGESGTKEEESFNTVSKAIQMSGHIKERGKKADYGI